MSQPLLTKWRQEAEFRFRILNVLLFYASEEGRQSLPNDEQNILLSLAGATVEYLSGDTTQVPQASRIFGDDTWTSRVNKVVGQVLDQNKKELSLELTSALKNILHIEWKSDHGEKWWETDIRWWLMFRQTGMASTFSLTHPEVLQIQNVIKPNITPTDLEHCKQIGLLMRKHILAACATAD